jgi:hypothetical protein
MAGGGTAADAEAVLGAAAVEKAAVVGRKEKRERRRARVENVRAPMGFEAEAEGAGGARP